MLHKVLFIKMLLLHYATQSEPEMYANCYEDVLVMCPGVVVDNMEFSSVAWYKHLNNTKLGIIRRGRDNKTKKYSNFVRSPKPRFGEKNSLLMSGVTPEDSGTYECEISANIGGQNQNFEVHLKVNDCGKKTEMTTMTPVLNTTEPDLRCHKQEDMPVMWSVMGYMAVGLAKIVSSLISIWVN
uniref:Si:dkey-109a10.2 n=1 Tax=Cyclopterus lumpus TaxID=8103 RepID=A0A8C3AKS6_CYCLU